MGFKTDPDEKGTERIIQYAMNAGMITSFKTDPDEKGTESMILVDPIPEDKMFQD